MDIEDIVSVLGDSLARYFTEMGAVNYIQLSVTSEKTGTLILTLQRKEGKTPHDLKIEAENALKEALARETKLRLALQDICDLQGCFKRGPSEDRDGWKDGSEASFNQCADMARAALDACKGIDSEANSS